MSDRRWTGTVTSGKHITVKTVITRELTRRVMDVLEAYMQDCYTVCVRREVKNGQLFMIAEINPPAGSGWDDYVMVVRAV